ITTVRLLDYIATDQRIDCMMQFNAPGFPRQFHPLPTCTYDIIVFDEQIRSAQPRNPANAYIFDRIAANDGISRNLFFAPRAMPTFVAYINPDRVRPIDRTIFDYPVMASVTRKRASL